MSKLQRIAIFVLLLGLLTGVALTQNRTANRRPLGTPPTIATDEYLPAKRYINPPTRPGQAPFSDAVEVNNTLYLSGRLGIDPRTGQVPAEFGTEVRIAMEGIRATLAEAGLTMDDLVMVQVFLSDLSAYEQFNTIYRGYFTRAVPARAIIGTGKLLRGARVEIQGIAVRTE